MIFSSIGLPARFVRPAKPLRIGLLALLLLPLQAVALEPVEAPPPQREIWLPKWRHGPPTVRYKLTRRGYLPASILRDCPGGVTWWDVAADGSYYPRYPRVYAQLL